MWGATVYTSGERRWVASHDAVDARVRGRGFECGKARERAGEADGGVRGVTTAIEQLGDEWRWP